ncbi:hypothetical protein Q664_44375 [Archangium violaceum Cb vi76]|uniref:Uncharacterized protein n=1 Tax=Archangium violaceum Cb vi76 TaxID=1406225 RepID=A0A084SHM8_9BACT|nr:hypothetical protein Q664_44375 [Archangium violaceum Cb vi76]
MTRPLGGELQQELVQLLHLRVAGASVLEPSALECLQLALHALLADEPNLQLVRGLRKRLESRLADRLHPLRLSAILRTDSPSIQVMLGLMCSLLLTLPVLIGSELLRLRGGFRLFGHLEAHLMVSVVLAGILGSTTSILVRIRDFDQANPAQPTSKVMMGFTKPLVGAAFALFGLLLFKSQALPIFKPLDEGSLQEHCFFLALSFVLGFSERLAQDLISQVEGRFESTGKAIHAPAPPDVSTGSGESPKG